MGVRTGTIEILPRPIADSRGDPTVEVEVRLGGTACVASVPAGKTKGGDEARTVPVPQAVANVEDVLLPFIRLANADLASHQDLVEVERRLVDRAGPNCADIGANALLPVSICLWRTAAALHGLSLCEYIRRFEPELASTRRVRFFSNVLNGGFHALRKGDGEVLGKDRFDFQEMQIVPLRAATYREALQTAERVDAALKALLVERYGQARVSRADEAGLTVQGLGDNVVALDTLVEGIRRAGLEAGRDVGITLDPASSHLYDAASRTYRVGGRSLSTEEYGRYLLGLLDRHPGAFVSVEDPLEENDWDGLARISAELKKRGVLVVGDDYYVTQRARLERGIADRSANGLLVKPNQNGSLWGTIEVMKLARRNGIELVISHRSGETLDETIADLATAVGAFGIKTGAPQPESDFPDPATWVRRRKYLRMIEIEEGQSRT